MQSFSQWWMWVGFFLLISVMLSIDILLLRKKKAHRVSTREAFSWVMVWISLAIVFNAFLWIYLSHTGDQALANQRSLEFLTGYLIEQSLSVDNLFVFILFFNYFAVPAEYQRRILLFGILGAIIMRLIMILLGVWIVSKFHWILYIFGLFLIITAIKMFIIADQKPDLANNPLLRWMRNHLKITEEYHGDRFFIRKNKILYATPLFLVLILIEFSDLVFAIDSIPAIFAITQEPFIIFTSNIFAILGLRSLYFLIANLVNQFHLLKYGLALILMLVGTKMLIAHWVAIPIALTLGSVALILLASVLLSMIKPLK